MGGRSSCGRTPSAATSASIAQSPSFKSGRRRRILMTGGPVSERLRWTRRSRPRGALWGNREFLKLWAGQSVSVVGDQISGLAIPLVAVLVLDASATQMGLLTAMVWLPHLLFSLGAGLYVDRRARRVRIMVATDVLRAAALGSIPVAYWLD